MVWKSCFQALGKFSDQGIEVITQNLAQRQHLLHWRVGFDGRLQLQNILFNPYCTHGTGRTHQRVQFAVRFTEFALPEMVHERRTRIAVVGQELLQHAQCQFGLASTLRVGGLQV